MVQKVLVTYFLCLSLCLAPGKILSEEEDENEFDYSDDEFYEEEPEEQVINDDDYYDEAETNKENEYDEDEFVGLGEESDSVEEDTQEAPKILDLTEVVPLPWWQKWILEITSISFIIMYGISFYIGGQTNMAIAMAWGKTFKDLFEEHFAKVGTDSVLYKQTQNMYSMRATGRINCVGLQVVLKLKRRQDLISQVWELFSKSVDLLVMDVAMLPTMEPMVFVILPIKSEKNYRKSNKDVDLFATPKPNFQKLPNFPETLMVLCDSDELAETLLVPKVVKVLGDYKEYIEAIHFTDHHPDSKYKKALRFIFKLPPKQKMEEMTLLIKMALFFIDQVHNISLSSATKKKVAALRVQAQAVAQKEKAEERQEALQKKKEEKRKKELEKYEQLSTEQRAKEDQKRARREAKKASQGFKYKVVYG